MFIDFPEKSEPMDRPSKSLPFIAGLSSESDLWRSSAQDMAPTTVQPHHTQPPYPPMPCTSQTSIPASRCLPPIQKLQAPSDYPTYSITAGGMSPWDLPENSLGFPFASCGDRYPPSQHPQWQDQPHASNDFPRMTPNLPRYYPEAGEYQMPINPQEPEYKRCRLGSQTWSTSLEVSDWEIDALAVAKSKNASRQASSQQVSLLDSPACSWSSPGNPTTGSSPPNIIVEHACKNGTWQQHHLAYPSPPHALDDNSRRLDYRGLSPRRTSSAFSDSTLTGSPEASRSTVGFDGHKSPPTSPATTSTTLGSDSRPCSKGPGDSIPTFEEIYDVPRVDLAPRETERTSILERFPMQIFMRIMMHCDWKKQILLRRCNSNLYDMVRLDAIPWETKTAILLYEENYNPDNFPKKASRPRKGHGPGGQDLDAASSSDDEGSTSSKINQGKRNRGKDTSKPKSRTKDKICEENIDRFACYSCFKILPEYYFEGRNLESKTSRTAKSQKRRGNNSQADKKVDTRVEYVQVISVNPSRPPEEWLVKDKAEVRATDVESYVAEYMKKGVNCDDLRLYYKDIASATHCIAPIRGVNPFFTASSSATPPYCETYRPVYRVDSSNTPGAAGVDNNAYTYEICIPGGAARDEGPMGRPHVGPVTRICQPQQQQATSDGSGVGPSAPAPQLKEIIALRRFCILCGAKYGAYRREDNRRIISKTVPEEGWWVCACPKVRQTGVGRNCPDCGKSVIY